MVVPESAGSRCCWPLMTIGAGGRKRGQTRADAGGRAGKLDQARAVVFGGSAGAARAHRDGSKISTRVQK